MSITKFKIGDYVYTNKKANSHYGVTKYGAIGIIRDLYSGNPYLYYIDFVSILPDHTWEADNIEEFIGTGKLNNFPIDSMCLSLFSTPTLKSRRTNCKQN